MIVASDSGGTIIMSGIVEGWDLNKMNDDRNINMVFAPNMKHVASFAIIVVLKGVCNKMFLWLFVCSVYCCFTISKKI